MALLTSSAFLLLSQALPPSDSMLAALLALPIDCDTGAPFVENRGQWRHDAQFVGRAPGGAVLLEPGVMELRLDSPRPGEQAPVVLRIELEGALEDARWEGRHVLQGVHHYLLGTDAERWRTDVPLHAALRCAGVRPGVDLFLRRHRGLLELDLALQPGAMLEQLAFRCEGAEDMEITPRGALAISAGGRVVELSPPVAWTVHQDGEQRPVPCTYLLLGGGRFGMIAPDRDPEALLVVDPQLVWSSYLGGSSWESAYAVDVDEGGWVTVVGQTGSLDFPTTAGAFDPTYNGISFSDVFVTRVEPDGSLAWSTFVGGIKGEEGCAVDVDSAGVVTVAGVTSSSDFPTTPGAHDSSLSGSSEAFVLRLSAGGSTLLSSTLLGGSGGDIARGVVAVGGGASILTGVTDSSDFPTTPGALSGTLGGGSDAFVARVSADGTALLASTLLGGSSGDTGEGLTVTASGAVVVVGSASSANFPTLPGAFDSQLDGSSDAFVAWMDPSLGSLTASTLLGGSSGDTPKSVAAAPNGDVVVTGVTSSVDFPTTAGAFDSQPSGTSDVFVTRVANGAGSLVFSSRIGGSSGEVAFGVALDSSEAPLVGGVTSSPDFPMSPDAWQPVSSGSSSAFIFRLTADGAGLAYASYLGGSSGDVGEAMDANTHGRAAIAGTTSSTGFPLVGAFDTTYSSPSESFVALFDLAATTACTAFCFGDGSGSSCPCGNTGSAGEGCANSTGSGAKLTCTGSASVAADDLVLRGSNLLPSAPALFFQGESAVNSGQGVLFGDGLRCAGGNVLRLQVVAPDESGTAATSVPIAAEGGNSAGQTRRYQCWYRDPSGSPCGNGFNLSHGLEVTWTP